ncbi:unnamed protein product [Amoebophrya sp. A120]|nr:unnamed protein product [Amoebophrya sp. A120]|eukprot:GSA120T00017903001.1
MMKSVLRTAAFTAAAASVAAAEKKSKAEPLLTASGTYDFVSNSVLMTKDLLFFTAETGTTLAFSKLPPNVKDQVLEKYDLAVEKMDLVKGEAESFRLKNGIPPLSEMVSVTQAKLKPVVALVESSQPFRLVQQFLDAFEKHYPQYAGKLSGIGFLDLLLVSLFLCYFVFGYMLKMFCFVCCCGCCAKRAKKQVPVELRKNKAPVAADKKKK